jgi:hypothetical protein
MGTIILGGLAVLVIGFGLGKITKKRKVITLSDRLVTKTWRSDVQRKQDAVLQLQNEILKSGAVKMKELANGDYRVTLKVVI